MDTLNKILEAGPAQWGCLLPTSVVQPQYMYDENFCGETAQICIDVRLSKRCWS